MTWLIIDVEASGLERSYPIEVAIADVNAGVVRAWLIKPTPAWTSDLVWSLESERLHGLSQALLGQHGQEAGAVAAEIVAFVGRRALLSDNPPFDKAWLEILFAGARSRAMPAFAEDSIVTELSYLAAARRRSAVDIAAINHAQKAMADHSAAGDAASWAAAAEALAFDGELNLERIDAIFGKWIEIARAAGQWRWPIDGFAKAGKR